MWCLVPCSLHSYYFTVQQGHAASRAHSVFLLKYCWHRGWAQDLRLLFMTFSHKYVSAFLLGCWRIEAITESGCVHLTKALRPFMPYALHVCCRGPLLRNPSASQEACSTNMMEKEVLLSFTMSCATTESLSTENSRKNTSCHRTWSMWEVL